MIKVLFIEDNDDHVYMLKYPGGSSGCVSIAPPLTRPSPNGRRVGIRIVTLGSLAARRIAQPPKAPLSRGVSPSGRPAEPLVSFFLPQ
jgi:hypothetical protein